jgi:hypothetical protein
MAEYVEDNRGEDVFQMDHSFPLELDSQAYTDRKDSHESRTVIYTAQGFVGILW